MSLREAPAVVRLAGANLGCLIEFSRATEQTRGTWISSNRLQILKREDWRQRVCQSQRDRKEQKLVPVFLMREYVPTFDSLILTAMTCFLWRMISTSSSHSSTSLASCMAVFTWTDEQAHAQNDTAVASKQKKTPTEHANNASLHVVALCPELPRHPITSSPSPGTSNQPSFDSCG